MTDLPTRGARIAVLSRNPGERREDNTSLRILEGPVDHLSAGEAVVAGTEGNTTNDLHTFEDHDRMFAVMGVGRLDISGREFHKQVQPSFGRILAVDLDEYAATKSEEIGVLLPRQIPALAGNEAFMSSSLPGRMPAH